MFMAVEPVGLVGWMSVQRLFDVDVDGAGDRSIILVVARVQSGLPAHERKRLRGRCCGFSCSQIRSDDISMSWLTHPRTNFAML